MDEETKKYIDDAEKRAKNFAMETAQKFDELRAEKGKWLRAKIIANPLPAARIAGAIGVILGFGLGYLVRSFL